MNIAESEIREELRPGSIEIINVSKCYSLDQRYRMTISDMSNLGDEDEIEDPEEETSEDQAIDKKLLNAEPSNSMIKALEDINISIAPGERLGFIGNDGAGKSTLLKIIAGILPPSIGEVHGNGRLVPIFSMLTPVQRNVSGRENLRVMGIFLGLPKKWMDRYLPQILEFSEIGSLIDHKVCFYPPGAFARLGTATALNVNPDIVMFDEKYAVGDAAYRGRLQDQLKKILDQGTTLICASKNVKMIKNLCNRVIWLQNGKIRYDGDCESVVDDFALNGDNILQVVSIESKSNFPIKEKKNTIEKTTAFPVDNEEIEGDLLPVTAWQKNAQIVESGWKKFISKIHEKKVNGPSNLVCNIPQHQAGELGSIKSLKVTNKNMTPVREIVPGEDIFIELLLGIDTPGVIVSVRLEFEAKLMLIFVSEPIVPLVATESGSYIFKTHINGNLYCNNYERVRHKIRTRVHFSKEPDHCPVVINATSWLDIRGDIRYKLDRLQSQHLTAPTCTVNPCPAYIEKLDSTPFSDYKMLPEGIGKDRSFLLKRQPFLRPRLEWSVFKIQTKSDDNTNSQH
jgi:ABC-2 type transport system ATP-binding protein/lipopolysaccharide transport system ATP-binding protein